MWVYARVGSNPTPSVERLVGGREVPAIGTLPAPTSHGLALGAWLSPVERCVRVAEVPGSNPGAPTVGFAIRPGHGEFGGVVLTGKAPHSKCGGLNRPWGFESLRLRFAKITVSPCPPSVFAWGAFSCLSGGLSPHGVEKSLRRAIQGTDPGVALKEPSLARRLDRVPAPGIPQFRDPRLTHVFPEDPCRGDTASIRCREGVTEKDQGLSCRCDLRVVHEGDHLSSGMIDGFVDLLEEAHTSGEGRTPLGRHRLCDVGNDPLPDLIVRIRVGVGPEELQQRVRKCVPPSGPLHVAQTLQP